MYDELVKRLQDYAAGTMRDDDAEIAFDAINAIEKLEHKVFILEGDREGLLAQIPRWIPVTERLPEEHVFVLILQDEDRMMVAERIDGDWWYRYFAYDVARWDGNEQGAITHWMPLPEPPKAEEGE